MGKYEEHGEAVVGFSVQAEAVYTEATDNRIVEDALFVRRAAGDVETESDAKRCARVTILLIALYLESLSNRIFLHCFSDPPTPDQTAQPSECVDSVDSRSDLPGPIRNFRAVYRKCTKKDLTLDTGGIQDVFTIRNRVLAHPSGRSQLHSNANGWTPRITSVKWRPKHARIEKQSLCYAKFKEFPSVYSHFTLREADQVLEEVRRFLAEYLGLLKGKVPKEQLDRWWPSELDAWVKSSSAH